MNVNIEKLASLSNDGRVMVYGGEAQKYSSITAISIKPRR